MFRLLHYSLFCRQQVIKSVPSEPDDAVMDSFNFLQREGQDAAEEEADDGGNADDELDDREFEDNRLSIKQRTKQGNHPLSSANVNTQGY